MIPREKINREDRTEFFFFFYLSLCRGFIQAWIWLISRRTAGQEVIPRAKMGEKRRIQGNEFWTCSFLENEASHKKEYRIINK